jgi:hypothetical protein
MFFMGCFWFNAVHFKAYSLGYMMVKKLGKMDE